MLTASRHTTSTGLAGSHGQQLHWRLVTEWMTAHSFGMAIVRRGLHPGEVLGCVHDVLLEWRAKKTHRPMQHLLNGIPQSCHRCSN